MGGEGRQLVLHSPQYGEEMASSEDIDGASGAQQACQVWEEHSTSSQDSEIHPEPREERLWPADLGKLLVAARNRPKDWAVFLRRLTRVHQILHKDGGPGVQQRDTAKRAKKRRLSSRQQTDKDKDTGGHEKERSGSPVSISSESDCQADDPQAEKDV